MPRLFYGVADRVIGGERLAREQALEIARALSAEPWRALVDLLPEADRVREAFRGRKADLCSIVSAKTGGCPEDCSYCAQSARSRADIRSSALIDGEELRLRAGAARAQGARRFCIVTSGRTPSEGEFGRILGMIGTVREAGLLPCATLGIVDEGRLRALGDAGLVRYHHNLETSERFFPNICSTHTYQDKIATIGRVRGSGLSLCSGGIFGLGEDWEDRIDMALALRTMGPDSVPINFLAPIPGTPLESLAPLPPLEALAVVALYRLILPEPEIRVAGGRVRTLGELGGMVFMAGADGLLTGDCLTTSGRNPADDISLIGGCGLTC